MPDRLEATWFAVAALYVVGLGWAMATLSYDVWGGLVIAPILVFVSVPLLRRVLVGEFAEFVPLAIGGLVAKLAGAGARYWVAFDSYGGSVDAARYHEVARLGAVRIRSGELPVTRLIPRSTGTAFIEETTTSLYAVVGSSRLAGFVVYSWIAYWGLLFFLLAAVIAVPGLAKRRYAVLVLFAPSLLYWPSSIGKEAWLCMSLGLTAYGGARLLTRQGTFRALLITTVGVAGANFVRPHLAAIWVAALAVAAVWGVLTGASGRHAGARLSGALMVAAAVVALVVVATFALRFLDPDAGDDVAVSDRIDQIFSETQRRSEQGGSQFTPIDVDSPTDWPYAVARTLTRPLPLEVDGVSDLLPALETGALLLLAAVGWRRTVNLPRMLQRSPYLLFGVLVLVMFGLAFASIGNLGILTRQRSLVLPLFLLLVCVPPREARPIGRHVPALTRSTAVLP